MGLPRSNYVQEGQEGVYHCFGRCVRRAFLCGFDPVTQQDFSHRKTWLVNRLRELAAVFAIEVIAYAIMATHYHAILRTRPDIVATWSNREVATRWLTLFSRHRGPRGETIPPLEEEIHALEQCPERIAQLRQRLCSLSWFMGRLNEFIARAANKEDQVKGRFWESRFKCQALLDEAAVAACMVYVDLNPIRAGLAETPEDSDFTSIQERFRAWRDEMMAQASVSLTEVEDIQPACLGGNTPMLEKADNVSVPVPERGSSISHSLEGAPHSACWLCPISSESQRRGILQMTAIEYFDLVDRSGRLVRSDKRGAIPLDLAPILLRIGAKPDAWINTISRFGSSFRLAAGLFSNLRNFAEQLGQRWLQGVATARASFASSPPQLA